MKNWLLVLTLIFWGTKSDGGHTLIESRWRLKNQHFINQIGCVRKYMTQLGITDRWQKAYFKKLAEQARRNCKEMIAKAYEDVASQEEELFNDIMGKIKKDKP